MNNDNEFKLDTNDIFYVPFVVGIKSGPVTIDPVDSFDISSVNVIDQVCEGLFRNNLSDPDMSRINWLAESYWWQDDITLHLKLREGILFHDNTPFNSTVAKWNLDRINYLTNATGTLPDTMDPAITHILWKFPNGTGIMRQIDIVNEYNITIHLNGPYGPFLNLLCFTGASMISPAFHSQTDYIDLSTGDLIGTGPFEYDGYNSSTEINFHAYDAYWQGKANINTMKFVIIEDSFARNAAIQSGDIDYLVDPLESYYSYFAADPNIALVEAPTPGLTYNYLGMNNKVINITWRKAISYAINYSYIIKELLNNNAIRAYSPISPGFGDGYYNCSDIAPFYNLTIARQTLIDDPGIDTTGLTANDNRDDSAWHAANLATFNYSYYNGFRADLYPFLVDCFEDIGITLEDNGSDYYTFIMKLSDFKDQLCLFVNGWTPDYIDPYNIFHPLMHSSSEYNSAQINIPWLDTKIEEILETADDNVRNTINHDIQINVSSYTYPHVFLYHPRQFFVYNVKLTNYPHNGYGKLYFYPCNWISLYTPPTISIDSPIEDQGFAEIAPIFNLSLSPDYIFIWYTINDGITNITCGTSGRINQTMWNDLAEGIFTLRFYANNSEGLIGTAEISLYKDTIDPIITIYEPLSGKQFKATPVYNITITEINLDSFWYSLDNGSTTIPITTYNGRIDEDEWNDLSYGDVHITFYALDNAGNLGFSSVMIKKSKQGIPGPYTVLILLIMLAGIIGFSWKQKQKLNKINF
ncbi:MAG: ABC transporter substrate-binding protein [Promethearchaeota archaeon]